MTKNGVPVGKIALTNLIFAIATLASGVILTVTGHVDQANLCFGACFGGTAGALVTTSVVIQQAGKDTTGNAQNSGGGAPSK